jgi:hypothetical protein
LCASRRSRLSDAFCTIDHDQRVLCSFLPKRQKDQTVITSSNPPGLEWINVDCETRIRRTGVPTRRSDYFFSIFFYNYRPALLGPELPGPALPVCLTANTFSSEPQKSPNGACCAERSLFSFFFFFMFSIRPFVRVLVTVKSFHLPLIELDRLTPAPHTRPSPHPSTIDTTPSHWPQFEKRHRRPQQRTKTVTY